MMQEIKRLSSPPQEINFMPLFFSRLKIFSHGLIWVYPEFPAGFQSIQKYANSIPAYRSNSIGYASAVKLGYCFKILLTD